MADQFAKLVLKCKLCDYVPPEDSEMAEFEMHFRLEHENADLAMELIPQCMTHGAFLRFIETKPTGGGFKDYFFCPVDNAETFIKRNA